MSPGGGSGNLADLVVAFQLQGQQALQAALAQVQQQVEQVLSAVQGLGQQLQTHMKQAQTQTAQTAGAVNGLRASMEQASANTQMALGAIVLAVNKLGVQMGQQAEKMKSGLQAVGKQAVDVGGAFGKLGGAVNMGLGAGVAALAGFIRQGMAAGVQGQLFQIQMERLSLSISGLMRPAIEKITSLVSRLATWLNSLSNEQRANIAHWIEGAAAALAVGVALPKVIAGLQGVAAAAKVAAAGIGLLESSTGIGALVPLLGLAVQGMTMLVVGTDGGREGLSRLWEATKPLVAEWSKLFEALRISDLLEGLGDDFAVLVSATAGLTSHIARLIAAFDKLADSKGVKMLHMLARLPLGKLPDLLRMLGYDVKLPKGKDNHATDIGRAGGFESLTATYERIARASVGARSPEEKSALHLENIDNRLRDLDPAVRNPRPEAAR